MILKKIFFSVLCFTAFTAKAQSNKTWQQQVNYNITAQLNPATKSIAAVATIEYINHSPDTLQYIWFHIWPNAYKNDKTAFCQQTLEHGNTEFYFSSPEEKGYINQLSFKQNNVVLKTEAHSQHIDIIKLLLQKPLLPNETLVLNTSFYVKLPYNFSRLGYVGNTYQATQWYPKPAVYDSEGWHPMPYLNYGEFYSEFGNYKVNITTPKHYIVAATGVLQNQDLLAWIKQNPNAQKLPEKKLVAQTVKPVKYKPKPIKATVKLTKPQHNAFTPLIKEDSTATWTYEQNNVHDFAWFASPNYLVDYDTVIIGNKAIDVFSFYTPQRKANFKNSTQITKEALKKYSEWIGNYPYSTATVVAGIQSKSGGMEYPTITYVDTEDSTEKPDITIAHEVGHNWFYGILANNERQHPWLDEGLNTFYQYRFEKYLELKKADKSTPKKKNKVQQQLTLNAVSRIADAGLQSVAKYLPIDTTAEVYSQTQYFLKSYLSAANWLTQIEQKIGTEKFDQAMQAFYKNNKFTHVTPKQLQQAFEQTANVNMQPSFNLLKQPNSYTYTNKKPLKLAFGFGLKSTDSVRYINILPAVSGNKYDGLRLGVLLHNIQLPINKLSFYAMPSVGLASKKFNFFGQVGYNIFKPNYWLQTSVDGSLYTYGNFTSTQNNLYQLNVQRLVPSVKLVLYNKDIKSSERTVLGFKTFVINKQNLNFSRPDSLGNYTITTPTSLSVLNNFYISKYNNRVLYPYHYKLNIEQAKDFLRIGFTANQFFNYGHNKGGIAARLFAGKFIYLTEKTRTKQYETSNYHFTLTGAKGDEDYTFSQYFYGRSDFEGWASQQIMERDGFFKMRTDMYSSKIGSTDDWMMAANFSADVPASINPLTMLPIGIKLKLYADIGTYADAWQTNASTGRFLYNAGLQLPLFNEAVNIYFPILYSKVYKDYVASVLGEKAFAKTISFTINFNNLVPKIIKNNLPL